MIAHRRTDGYRYNSHDGNEGHSEKVGSHDHGFEGQRSETWGGKERFDSKEKHASLQMLEFELDGAATMSVIYGSEVHAQMAAQWQRC
jgi:hypothetical protein